MRREVNTVKEKLKFFENRRYNAGHKSQAREKGSVFPLKAVQSECFACQWANRAVGNRHKRGVGLIDIPLVYTFKLQNLIKSLKSTQIFAQNAASSKTRVYF